MTALEKLPEKWRARADDLYTVNLEMSMSEIRFLQGKAEGLDEAADELATLCQSLAGQGEASTPRAAEAVSDEMKP